jgi:hypothetical protein
MNAQIDLLADWIDCGCPQFVSQAAAMKSGSENPQEGAKLPDTGVFSGAS